MFVDGDIQVSDLAINVPSVPATTPYFLFGFWKVAALIDAVPFMGQYSTNASVERVAITGMPDNSDTGLYGHNVNNGAAFLGEFPRSQTPFDFYFLSGTFSVTDSYFKNVSSGTEGASFLRDSHMVIGGSPTSGNVFEDVVVGVDLESIDNSVIEASYNNVAVEGFAGVYIAPWCCRVTSKPSLFLVHDNTLSLRASLPTACSCMTILQTIGYKRSFTTTLSKRRTSVTVGSAPITPTVPRSCTTRFPATARRNRNLERLACPVLKADVTNSRDGFYTNELRIGLQQPVQLVGPERLQRVHLGYAHLGGERMFHLDRNGNEPGGTRCRRYRQIPRHHALQQQHEKHRDLHIAPRGDGAMVG